jgi:hypothetical protein
MLLLFPDADGDGLIKVLFESIFEESMSFGVQKYVSSSPFRKTLGDPSHCAMEMRIQKHKDTKRKG